MLLHKLGLAVMSLLLVAVVAGGQASQSFNAFADPREGEPRGEPFVKVVRTEPRPADEPAPMNGGSLTSVGRVLDPEGRPMPNARIAVLSDRKRVVSDLDGQPPSALATATPTPTANSRSSPRPSPHTRLGSLEADRDRALALGVVELRPTTPTKRHRSPWRRTGRRGPAARRPGAARRGGHHRAAQGCASGRPGEVPALRCEGFVEPLALTGDDETPTAGPAVRSGRKSAGDVRSRGPTVRARGVRVPRRRPRHQEGRADAPARYHGHAAPGSALDVSVVHDDDGRPVAGGRIDVRSFDGKGSPGEVPRTRTDGRGHARVIPWPGDRFWIFVYAPEGEPYLPARLDVNWPKGAVRHAVEVRLGRGALVRGRLIEDLADTPVVGGWIGYQQTRRRNTVSNDVLCVPLTIIVLLFASLPSEGLGPHACNRWR